MKISTRSLYGLRLLYNLALNYNQGPQQLSEIAAREAISEKYLSQIVIILRTSGLITSVRGALGGYLLARRPQEITVLQVIQCLEVELLVTQDIDVNANSASDSLFATNEIWDRLHLAVSDTLGAISLQNMIDIPQKARRVLDYNI